MKISLRKIGHEIDRFIGGRGKTGRWNPYSYPHKFAHDNLWKKIGLTKRDLFGRSNSAQVVSSYRAEPYGPTGSIIGRY